MNTESADPGDTVSTQPLLSPTSDSSVILPPLKVPEDPRLITAVETFEEIVLEMRQSLLISSSEEGKKRIREKANQKLREKMSLLDLSLSDIMKMPRSGRCTNMHIGCSYVSDSEEEFAEHSKKCWSWLFDGCVFPYCVRAKLCNFETFESFMFHLANFHRESIDVINPGEPVVFAVTLDKTNSNQNTQVPELSKIVSVNLGGTKKLLILACQYDKENDLLYIYGLGGAWKSNCAVEISIKVFNGTKVVPPASEPHKRQKYAVPFQSPLEFIEHQSGYRVMYQLSKLWKPSLGNDKKMMIHLFVEFNIKLTQAKVDENIRLLQTWEDNMELHKSIKIPFLSAPSTTMCGMARIVASAITSLSSSDLILEVRDSCSTRLGMFTPLLNQVIVKREDIQCNTKLTNTHGIKPIMIYVTTSNVSENILLDWIDKHMEDADLHVYSVYALGNKTVRDNAIKRCDVLITSVKNFKIAIERKSNATLYLTNCDNILFWSAESMMVMKSLNQFSELMEALKKNVHFRHPRMIFQYNERRNIESQEDVKWTKPGNTKLIQVGPIGQDGLDKLRIICRDVSALGKDVQKARIQALTQAIGNQNKTDRPWVIIQARNMLSEATSGILHANENHNVVTVDNNSAINPVSQVKKAIAEMQKDWSVFLSTPYLENSVGLPTPNVIILYGLPRAYVHFMSILRFALHTDPQPEIKIININEPEDKEVMSFYLNLKEQHNE